jgi:predicted RNA binding protein YcfA (HicA-like mRNA interferase family)
MLSDVRPTTYTYADAAAVLNGLGFEVAPHGGGSHRRWRHRSAAGNVVVIGLVDSGSGPLKPYLIRDLVSSLREHGFTS